jgi:hypothetical protein
MSKAFEYSLWASAIACGLAVQGAICSVFVGSQYPIPEAVSRVCSFWSLAGPSDSLQNEPKQNDKEER